MIRAIYKKLLGLTAGKTRLIEATGRPGEKITGREHIQHFGFSSNPPSSDIVKTQSVFIQLGNHMVCVAEEAPDLRPEMDSGEASLYTKPDVYVFIGKDDSIKIKTTTTVTVEAASISLTSGALALLGNIVTTLCSCPLVGVHAQGSSVAKAAL